MSKPTRVLKLLLPNPLVRHDGPTTLQVTVNEQPDENRWIVHLLHYIPERRSQEIVIIEAVIPLYNVKISVKLPKIKDVMSVPEQGALPYKQNPPAKSAIVRASFSLALSSSKGLRDTPADKFNWLIAWTRSRIEAKLSPRRSLLSFS